VTELCPKILAVLSERFLLAVEKYIAHKLIPSLKKLLRDIGNVKGPCLEISVARKIDPNMKDNLP
jgi:hypothetical protein